MREDVGGTSSRKSRCRNGVHALALAEGIHEEEDVGVSPWRNREEDEVVNAYGDTRTERRRGGEDSPARRLSRGIACLILETATK